MFVRGTYGMVKYMHISLVMCVVSNDSLNIFRSDTLKGQSKRKAETLLFPGPIPHPLV